MEAQIALLVLITEEKKRVLVDLPNAHNEMSWWLLQINSCVKQISF